MSRADQHIDRRTLIRSGTAAALAAGTTVNLGASAAAKAVPLAGRADPIYAAIINHRSAWEATKPRLKHMAKATTAKPRPTGSPLRTLAPTTP